MEDAETGVLLLDPDARLRRINRPALRLLSLRPSQARGAHASRLLRTAGAHDDLLADAPALAERTYLLEDCTSPVVVPGVVDYTEEADAAFARFAAAGMHVVLSTDPLETWSGLDRGA